MKRYTRQSTPTIIEQSDLTGYKLFSFICTSKYIFLIIYDCITYIDSIKVSIRHKLLYIYNINNQLLSLIKYKQFFF